MLRRGYKDVERGSMWLVPPRAKALFRVQDFPFFKHILISYFWPVAPGSRFLHHAPRQVRDDPFGNLKRVAALYIFPWTTTKSILASLIILSTTGRHLVHKNPKMFFMILGPLRKKNLYSIHGVQGFEFIYWTLLKIFLTQSKLGLTTQLNHSISAEYFFQKNLIPETGIGLISQDLSLEISDPLVYKNLYQKAAPLGQLCSQIKTVLTNIYFLVHEYQVFPPFIYYSLPVLSHD
ncbi:uncharacterized protein VP01_444g2 [Puccinia sorghi]|uniref:Uncharacterized protein n=1 Tax=Puccinia sorghi TaxID=27349 RepID=A0A0L6URD8_9BASI|nr:uncharacterized protein VP01_444g2 [Puccinia sorghi]